MAVSWESLPGALTPKFMQEQYRRINLYDNIDKSVANKVIEQLEDACRYCNRRGTSIVFVFIDCAGGSLYESLRILESLERAKRFLTVATVIHSTCFSAAVPIFLAGDRGFRFVAPDGVLMIHPPVFRDLAHPRHTPTQDAMDEKHLESLRQRLHQSLTQAQPTNEQQQLFANQYRQFGNTDWFLSADEMLAFGLADYKEVPEFVHEVVYRPRVVLQQATLKIGRKRLPARLRPVSRA